MSHAHRGDQAGAGSSRETYPRKETLHDEGVNESFGSSPPLPTPSLSTAQDGPAGSLTVRLAGAGRAEEADVGVLLDPGEPGEVEHERLLGGGLRAPVEVLERFQRGGSWRGGSASVHRRRRGRRPRLRAGSRGRARTAT